jgi:signal transduction histidine kinase
MSAINAYLGVYHLLLALRRPQAREHLPFALLCFAVAGYDIFCVGLYDAESVADGVFWQRLQLQSVLAIASMTVWFIARLTGNERKRSLRRIQIGFAVLAPLTFVRGDGLTVSEATPAIKHIVIASRPLITYHESDVGAFFLAVIISAFCACVYMVVVLLRHYRHQRSRTILSLLIGISTYFIGVTNDSLVAAQVYPFIYISEYAFFILTLAMGYVLLTRFVDLQSRVEASNAELERKVAERTAALERSLAQQSAMQAKLIAASRRTGMADVATRVLHGIGNALNSVGVSVDTLDTALRGSRLAGLAKVSRLIGEHRDDLPGFFATASQARLLPDYLAAATTRLEDERTQLADELAALRRHVEHIKQAVDTQQLHVGAPSISEPTSLAAVVDEAIASSLVRHLDAGVEVERDYAEVPELDIDRHKLLQVVSSLVDHAWQAISGAPGGDKRIWLRLRLQGGDRVAIEIEDNGPGLARDDLTRIFHPDAAPRPRHGFDLHDSACAAAEMKGTLRATSDGPGRGACFTLSLPLPAPA